MTHKTPKIAIIGAFALLFAFVPRAVFADDILNVSIDTATLAGQAGSEVVFELTDGSGTGDANNTAALSGFTLGSGTLGSVDSLNSFGAYSGDLGSVLTLTDGSFLTLFGQFLTPGNALSFTLDLTTNVDAGGTPDQFSTYLYDGSGNPLATTTDPTGFDSLLTINLDSANPITNNYDTALVTASAPTVPTPEPETLALLAIGLAGLALVSLRRVQARLARTQAESAP